MGMWIVVLRSASTAKKNELWFIVNSVPIRYSLREVRHISGLYCHEYPTNHERLDGTSFMNKYFERKMVTYADVEKQMLAMKGKRAQDRQKMAVIGEGATPVDSFFLTVVDDLDACLTFPWGWYQFKQNLQDVSSFLEKCKGVVPTSWVFTSFHVPLQVFSSSSCS
ncbi:hypothetical protein BRARA_A02446 [Brassica rapa]|uniref:DUF1985 domain-containing protein n=1 Tax=Brassica campestris TaxID=3711 RepID=A0A398AQ85_BRACM|nr:hypothetical protein BRARA_A02446 [Brassica rapa]